MGGEQIGPLVRPTPHVGAWIPLAHTLDPLPALLRLRAISWDSRWTPCLHRSHMPCPQKAELPRTHQNPPPSIPSLYPQILQVWGVGSDGRTYERSGHLLIPSPSPELSSPPRASWLPIRLKPLVDTPWWPVVTFSHLETFVTRQVSSLPAYLLRLKENLSGFRPQAVSPPPPCRFAGSRQMEEREWSAHKLPLAGTGLVATGRAAPNLAVLATPLV